jgi:hypothetical protein
MPMNWAQHLVDTEEAQRQLVEQAIARAVDEPFSLPEEPIDKALFDLRLQIARSDMAIGIALGQRTAMAAEFR